MQRNPIRLITLHCPGSSAQVEGRRTLCAANAQIERELIGQRNLRSRSRRGGLLGFLLFLVGHRGFFIGPFFRGSGPA